MSILSNIFGGGGHHSRDPMREANKYLGQIPETAHKSLDPYINQGQDASAKLKEHWDKIMANPQAFLDEINKSYEPSAGYQYDKDKLTKELSATAAAGGIRGTPLDQMNQAEGIHGLMDKDRQQYIKNVLGIGDRATAGEQDFADKGFDSSKSLSDQIIAALNQQGGLAFNSTQQKNSDRNSIISAIIKALGTGAGGFFGGPIGAAVGGAVGS